MPRFHFHIEDGTTLRDPEGLELRDIPAAQVEAALHFAELLKSRREEIWTDRALKLTVTDDRDLTLFVLEATVTLAAALGASRRSGA